MKLNELFYPEFDPDTYLEEKLIQFGGGKAGRHNQIVFVVGGGACHAKGTEVLMYDGSYKNVEDISVNDRLMGTDSTVRTVDHTHHGVEKMLEVMSNKGDSYICNYNHKHSFICSFSKCGLIKNKIYDMTFDEFNQLKPSTKLALKLFKTNEIEFEYDGYSLDINPWLIGFWIGDGTRKAPQFTIQSDSPLIEYIKDAYENETYKFNELKKIKPNCQNYSLTTPYTLNNPFLDYVRDYCEVDGEKRIPKELLLSTIDNRKSLLSGLIDSDGYYDSGCYEIITKWESLKNDIEFLCGSLGYRVKSTIKRVKWNGEFREYYRIFISGDFQNLPIQLKYKRPTQSKNKDPLRMGFSISVLEEGEYYGFSIREDDKHFILKNWLVSHNSGKGFAIQNFLQKEKFKVLDVDEFKSLLLKVDDLKQKYPEIRNLKLSNPKDVFKLHMFVEKLGLKDKSLRNLLKNKVDNRLPNILFDITFKDVINLKKTVNILKTVGYDVDNINLVWVLTNYHIAVTANKTRDRIVPDDVLLKTHSGAASNMIDLLNGKGGVVPKFINGDIHVILNNREETVYWMDSEGKEVIRKRLVGGEMKDIKFIKSFTSIKVKKSGKPLTNNVLDDKLKAWIKENVPLEKEIFKKLDEELPNN